MGRRRTLLMLLAGWLVLVLVAAACGDDDDDGAAADETETETTETTAEQETAEEPAAEDEGEGDEGAAADGPYRAVLFYPGSNDDLSWSNAWFDGAQEAAAEIPELELEFVELLNDPDEFVQQGSSFASDGADLLLFAHGAMLDPALQVAEQFPDTQVCLAPHQPTEETLAAAADNLCFIDIAQHDADFLAGALAALLTETGSIGSINGFEFPALTRQPESFVLGARCVNPDIGFEQTYINTWTDTAAAKAATQGLIGGGADIVLSATDQAVLGAIDAAEEAEGTVFIIPSYYDSNSISPEVVITSAVHGLQDASHDVLVAAVNGEITANRFFDFNATNAPRLDIAPLYEQEELLSAENKAIFDDIEARVRAGEIMIPDETLGDTPIGIVGAGSEIDVTAIGCTPGA